MVRGWAIPPSKTSAKSTEDFARERATKVRWLVEEGFVRSERLRQALLKVPREQFIPAEYRDYAYQEVPLPLPGERSTISCPHSYPLFYEQLRLDRGQRFLEVGLGSGYGAAVAREVVGSDGLVVSIEIDPVTFAYARDNLERMGYEDVVVVNADGALGYAELSPYDAISITAACRRVPHPLIDQLRVGGRLTTPLVQDDRQDLVLLEKTDQAIKETVICPVLYMSLRGEYGS